MAKKEIQIADKETLDRVKHCTWLSDYKKYGEESYVYINKDFLYELYRDYELSMNDPVINSDAFYYANQINEVGLAIQAVYGLNYTGDLDLSNIKKYTDKPFKNEAVLEALVNNITFIDLINRLGSKVSYSIGNEFLTAVANSKKAITEFYTLSRNKDSGYSMRYVYFLSNRDITMASQFYKILEDTYTSDANTTQLILNSQCFLIGISQTFSVSNNYQIKVKEELNSDGINSKTLTGGTYEGNMGVVNSFYKRVYVNMPNMGYNMKTAKIRIYYLEF